MGCTVLRPAEGFPDGVVACRIDPPRRSQAPSYLRQQPLSQDEGIFGRASTKAAAGIALIPRCIPAEREVFLVYYPSLVTRCRLGWRRTWCPVCFHSVAPPLQRKNRELIAPFLQLFDKGRLFFWVGGEGVLLNLTYTN